MNTKEILKSIYLIKKSIVNDFTPRNINEAVCVENIADELDFIEDEVLSKEREEYSMFHFGWAAIFEDEKEMEKIEKSADRHIEELKREVERELCIGTNYEIDQKNNTIKIEATSTQRALEQLSRVETGGRQFNKITINIK